MAWSLPVDIVVIRGGAAAGLCKIRGKRYARLALRRAVPLASFDAGSGALAGCVVGREILRLDRVQDPNVLGARRDIRVRAMGLMWRVHAERGVERK
jgi:hypothetical protein